MNHYGNSPIPRTTTLHTDSTADLLLIATRHSRRNLAFGFLAGLCVGLGLAGALWIILPR